VGWSGKDFIMRSFVIFIAHQILFGSSNKEERDGLGLQNVWFIKDLSEET
jgi:hypothetical protein